MALLIPDDIVLATRMTDAELRCEIAVMLFRQEKLTLGQSNRLAGMDQLAFQHLLASREIPLHYGVADFEADLDTLRTRHEQ